MEYTSNFSINSHLYTKCEKVIGYYNDETNVGLVFLDAMSSIVADEYGPCGPSWITVGQPVPKKDISEAEEFFLGNSKVCKHNKKKWIKNAIRKNTMVRYGGEADVVKRIIEIDFHEFIHHFLHTNNIENHCCDEKAHNHDVETGPVGFCWLCCFTHNLRPKINMPKTTRQVPEVLAYIDGGEEEPCCVGCGGE